MPEEHELKEQVAKITKFIAKKTRLFTLRECAEIVHDLRDNYKGHLQGIRELPDNMVVGATLKRRTELIGGTVALADIESQIEDLIEQEEKE